jgi:hypothetical protein
MEAGANEPEFQQRLLAAVILDGWKMVNGQRWCLSDEAVSDEEGISSSKNDVERSAAREEEEEESGFFRLRSVMVGRGARAVG